MVRHMGILFLRQFHSRCAVRKAEYARSTRKFSVRSWQGPCAKQLRCVLHAERL